MIIYSKNSNLNNAAYGKFQTPIRMVIENESDILSKKGGVRDWLFNVEKSNRFGETIINHNEFSTFLPVSEGSSAETDTSVQTGYKFIEHIQYMKEFIVTAEMLEDSIYGLGADAKRRAESFTRAYYKTMNYLCEYVLANGTFELIDYGNTNLNISTADNYPLFYKNHKWGTSTAISGTQSNAFYGNLCTTGTGSDKKYSVDAFEEALAELTVKIRNMKDENGKPMGYNADTLILPCNRGKLEQIAKKVCGSEYAAGVGNDGINLHYGRWNVIVLPHWQSGDDRFMVMSSEANKNLSGNMFFNRVPLTITDWVDHHTGNYYWSGRCRFGIGFGSYKHILLAVDSTNDLSSEYTKI